MSKPNIILHIGAEKTGSTTIQKSLTESIPLISQTFRYPIGSDLPDFFEGRHVGILKASGCFWSWKDKPFHQRNHTEREKYKTFYFNKLRDFVERCQNEGGLHFILSEENLSSRLKLAEIEKITDNISEIFEKKSVVMLIRDQFSAYVSQYSTYVSNGKTHSLKKFLHDHRHSKYFNYYEIIRMWESCGWNVELGFHGPDAIEEFSNIVYRITQEKISLNSNFNPQNVSFKFSELFVLRNWNKLPFCLKLFRMPMYLCLRFARSVNFTPLKIQSILDLKKEIDDYYLDGNKKIANKFFNRDNLF